MATPPCELLSPRFWKDYALIDSGNYEKLERFGDFVLARPEPQAVWDKKLSEKEWEARLNARYVREKGRNDLTLTSEKGRWHTKIGMKDKWAIHYGSPQMDLHLNLSLTSFGHIGVFPEQAENWEFIYENTKRLRETPPRVLNLFAYTGAATLAACAAGAEVTHVDSVKQVVTWASQNKESSRLQGVTKWIVEDAMKFVKRQARRGNTYHGIILDPPAYGRGAEGEKWLLHEHLNELMHACTSILQDSEAFLLLNIYSVGFSSVVLDTLTASLLPHGKRASGELVLHSETDQRLPLGAFSRVVV